MDKRVRRVRVKPWPVELGPSYRDAYNELLRIEAMLETCLAENEIDNPFLFEVLLPKVAIRIRRLGQIAEDMLLLDPEGQGRPPRWLRIVRQLLNICRVMAETLDSLELKIKIRQQRFVEVEHMTCSMLQAIRFLKKQLGSVPMENSRFAMTRTGFVEIILSQKL